MVEGKLAHVSFWTWAVTPGLVVGHHVSAACLGCSHRGSILGICACAGMLGRPLASSAGVATPCILPLFWGPQGCEHTVSFLRVGREGATIGCSPWPAHCQLFPVFLHLSLLCIHFQARVLSLQLTLGVTVLGPDFLFLGALEYTTFCFLGTKMSKLSTY